ncbi:MAG: triose-phosphate isomerase [Patescibacteria group bacterium]
MSKRTLVVGNWKMNPATLDEAKVIVRKTRQAASELAHTDVVVCPPFVFISSFNTSTEAPHMYLGVQSVSPYTQEGPHTGEVGVHMLRDLKVEYVITGHSEERSRGVSDEEVSKSVSAIVHEGMMAIVCVGERQRDDAGTYLETLTQQIRSSLAGIEAKHAKNLVIAYEPIWAIGATEAMNPEQVCEMSIFVKKICADIFGPEIALKIKVLYGGAVNAENASSIITIGKVDGLLVGRESVHIDGFVELLRAVDVI